MRAPAATKSAPLVDVETMSTRRPRSSFDLPEKQETRQARPRMHHLDWLRLLLVAAVVLEHTVRSGLSGGGGGFCEAWRVDDRTLIRYKDYTDLYSCSKTSLASQCAPAHHATSTEEPPQEVERSPLEVRWVSIVRQSTLPLLFWVSGASLACSYRGGPPRGLLKLAAYTFLGMGVNAVLWVLSPMDPACFIDNPDCEGRGLVFNFTIVPWAGVTFAILFQMWYTVMLAVFCVCNWPLLAVVHGSAGSRLGPMSLQWLINMAWYLFFLFLAGGMSIAGLLPHAKLIGLLGITEVAFLALVPLVSLGFEGCKRPAWVPVRAVHYLLATLAVVQFGALPFAERIDTIGPIFILYLYVGFNRFFNLGAVMTFSQLGAQEDTAEPLLSRVWPLALILFVAAAPSTNWDVAGMLTYPFFPDVTDRALYVVGAVAVVFLMDRCSRSMKCDAVPGLLGQASLILYLLHPALVTVLLHFGVRSVGSVWLPAAGIALLISATLAWVQLLLARSRDAQDVCSCSSEDEDSEGSVSRDTREMVK